MASLNLRDPSQSSKPVRRHLSIPIIKAPCRKRMPPVAVTKVLVETTMVPLTKVAEVMKTVEMAAMSRIPVIIRLKRRLEAMFPTRN